jgi:uncharacterized HAD superfamily protein
MSKPIIAVDIDDVLANENEGMRQFINNAYGLSLTEQDYAASGPYWGYWEKVWGVDEAEGRRRYQAYLDARVSKHHVVIDGAIESINELKKAYDLVVVTSRYDTLVDLTEAWLAKHFPAVFKQLEFVSVWSKSEKVTKAMICKQIGAQYLIDDSVEHCTLAVDAGITALLFGDFGWNRTEKVSEHIVRVKDWQAVKRYFDERS